MKSILLRAVFTLALVLTSFNSVAWAEEGGTSSSVKFDFLNFRGHYLFAVNSIGYTSTGQLYYSPHFRFGQFPLGLRALAGGTFLKNKTTNALFFAPEFQILATYAFTKQFFGELGGGIQYWTSDANAVQGMTTLQGGYSLDNVLGGYLRALVGGASVSFGTATTFQARLGVEFGI
jgi:hypothetical protein